MRTQLANVLAVILLTLTAVVPGPVSAADPDLPPGLDPGGTPIAIISTGLDYTDPQIANRLARDGEGQLIGWDFVDNDLTPYAADPVATALARLLLLTHENSRLVIVRVNPDNAQQLAHAAAFIARTPARIAAVPLAGPSRKTWAPFLSVTRKMENTLFFLAAGTAATEDDLTPLWPGAAKQENSVVTAPFDALAALGSTAADDGSTALVDVWLVPDIKIAGWKPSRVLDRSAQSVMMLAAHAGCLLRKDPKLQNAIALRSALLAQRFSLPNWPKFNVHDPKCQNGKLPASE